MVNHKQAPDRPPGWFFAVLLLLALGLGLLFALGVANSTPGH
jgi:hypothetical protein